MTTVNVQPNGVREDSGGGLSSNLIALVAIILVVFLCLYLLLPILRRATTQSTVPQVNIPDQIDVNVNTPQQ